MSWQHLGAAQPRGAGAVWDPAKGQGVVCQGEIQQPPSKKRTPALGLPCGIRARLNAFPGQGECGGGASLQPFICLHIWGWFFLLEAMLHLTPPPPDDFCLCVSSRRGCGDVEGTPAEASELAVGQAALFLLPRVVGKGGGC